MALLREIQEYFQLNTASSCLVLTWDAMKAVVRGLYIREITKQTSKSRELTVALQNRVSETESAFEQNPSPASKSDWDKAQTSLNDHMLLMADNKTTILQ